MKREQPNNKISLIGFWQRFNISIHNVWRLLFASKTRRWLQCVLSREKQSLTYKIKHNFKKEINLDEKAVFVTILARVQHICMTLNTRYEWIETKFQFCFIFNFWNDAVVLIFLCKQIYEIRVHFSTFYTILFSTCVSWLFRSFKITHMCYMLYVHFRSVSRAYTSAEEI